jgi:hypothetical protein
MIYIYSTTVDYTYLHIYTRLHLFTLFTTLVYIVDSTLDYTCVHSTLVYIYIYSTTVDYTCLHCWFYNYNNFLINQYIDHQFSRVLGAALSSTSLIACTRSALCVLGGRQMPFGQTSCTLTCIQALTALHSDRWPLQSHTYLQDDIDYARTTKTEHSTVLT